MRFGSVIAICVLTVLTTSVGSMSAEPEHLKRALALVEAYRASLDRLAGVADEMIVLRRLRTSALTLASLADQTVSNKVLARYEPKDAAGKLLDSEAGLNATEDFLLLMAYVAGSARSLERCIAAIDSPEAQSGFEFLPIGHAMLANRFLPAPVVEGALRAADFIGRSAALSPQEVAELKSALTMAAGYYRVEQRGSAPCGQLVSGYTDIRLRDDADPEFIIRLDAETAHTQIRLLNQP